MHNLVRTHPLATLITLGTDGITANHVPLHLSTEPLPFGTLQGHVARANPIWTDLVPDVEALAVFQGPEAYISPSWYATKQQTGKVVPTWNYIVVHAHGHLRVTDDAQWLRSQIEKLTSSEEASFAEPWQTSDAPDDYIQKLMGAIVGIELVITKLSGKWKVSQNQPYANQIGVIEGLQSLGGADSETMAKLISDNGSKMT